MYGLYLIVFYSALLFSMKITLVRHGLTDWNVARKIQWHIDIELNTIWKKQATDVAYYLQEEDFDFMMSSDLKRASNTARAIFKYHPSSVYNEDKRLREKHLWIFQWMKIEDIFEYYTLKDRDEYYEFVDSHDSVESRENTIFRIAQCIDEVVQAGYQNICIVWHWWTLKLIRNYLLCTYDNDVKFKNCSVSKYKFHDWKRNELILSDVNHLDEWSNEIA